MELYLRVLATTVALAGVLTGCFSEHGATAPVVDGGRCDIPLQEGLAGSVVIVIDRFAYGPGDLTIRAGERVTWVNCDLESHTSTADGGEWASPLLAPGDAFTQTFATNGEFSYHCEPHPFMTGRVIVQ